MARRQTGGRIRALIFLIGSLVVAGIAVALVLIVLASYQSQLVQLNAPQEVAQVVTAIKDLSPGQIIVVEDVGVVTLPPDYVPESALRQKEQAVGRVPLERILPNEFIREERLADPAAGVGLNAIIPKGMRALSINISSGSAVSGFLNPGNYVDVIITLRPNGVDQTETVTFTMMQAVTVLAVNTRMSESADGHAGEGGGRPSVTLAVTPDQAERITHALNQADITLTLRNDIDVTNLVTNGAKSTDLLGGAATEKRIDISEWKQRASTGDAPSDGTLIIIKGPSTTNETVAAP